MKQHSLLNRFILGAFVLSMGAVGCDEKDDVPATPKTITQIVVENQNFSVLEAAVLKVPGLADALSQGSLTVFAPDNAAFAASGITEATINSLSVQAVDSILKYHVLATAVGSGQVPVSDAVPTLNGTQLYASRNGNGVFVNGIRVKQADLPAANGIIHVIERVLIPPTRTIAGIAAGDPNFSILVAAVQRAGLLAAIQGSGKFTVFAPTNAAFAAAGFPDEASINAAPEATVASIVQAHVLPTNVFASDLVNNASVATIRTNTSLTVTLPPPAVKISNSSNPASEITTANLTATNGVVHVINRVLL